MKAWIAALVCFPMAPAAAAQVYFSSDQNVERPIIRAIDHATDSIRAALFEINSPPLIEALQRAAERGVHVRILLQKDGKRGPALRADFLPQLDIRWSGGRSRRGIMHHKFAVFDEQCVVTGSYNWTRGASHANYENALFEDDADVVKAYMQQFEWLWARARMTKDGAPGDRTENLGGSTHHTRRRRRRSVPVGSLYL